MASGLLLVIVLLVHGFNVSDPERTIGGMAPHLRDRGHDVHTFCYGHAGFIDVRFANENLSYAIASQVRSIKALKPELEVVLVGHSNGAALIHRAAELQGTPLFTRCVYVSPALDNKAELPPLLTRCDVMHTQKDTAVSFGSLMLFHKWGNMGKVGYRGDDPRYHNIDCSKQVTGHSEWFRPETLGFTLDVLDEVLSSSPQ
mgnify:CR=1 FL=1